MQAAIKILILFENQDIYRNYCHLFLESSCMKLSSSKINNGRQSKCSTSITDSESEFQTQFSNLRLRRTMRNEKFGKVPFKSRVFD